MLYTIFVNISCMSRHEFLAPEEQEYKDCINCGIRKSLVCITCGYCYECHPIIEAIETRSEKVPYSISRLDNIEPA